MWGNNNYSQTLRNLIYEYWYEMPAHRRMIRDPKKAVVLGCQNVEHASGASGGEPWEDFRLPELTDYKPERHGQQQEEYYPGDLSDHSDDDNSDDSPWSHSSGEHTPNDDSSDGDSPRTNSQPPGHNQLEQ